MACLWWVLNVVDHFSRRAVGFAVFKCRPASEEVHAAFIHHGCRTSTAQTLDCRSRLRVQVRAFRERLVRSQRTSCEIWAVTTMMEQVRHVARLERLPPASRSRSIRAPNLCCVPFRSRLHPTILVGLIHSSFPQRVGAGWSRRETTRLLRDRCSDEKTPDREIAIRLLVPSTSGNSVIDRIPPY